MNRSPAFQFYPDKWQSHTRRLSNDSYRVFHELLCAMWQHSPDHCSVEASVEAVAALVAMPVECVRIAIAEINNAYAPLLRAEAGRWVCNGLRKEAEKQKTKREKAKVGANARWKDANASEPDANASSKQCIPTPTPTPTPTPLLNGVGGGDEVEMMPSVRRYGDARIVLHLLNELTGRRYRETDPNLSVIAARIKEPGVDLDGVKQMLQRQVKRWKGTAQEEFLRPETLFGKSKFDSYYAARDQPVPEQNGHTTTNSAQLIVHQQELTRIESEIKRIDNSVESHMELPPEDRAKRKQLKERREIVKRILGVAV